MRLSMRSLAIALACGSTLIACQSDEEKLATALESGRAYARQQQHAEAVIEFRRALSFDPNSAEAHFRLGESYVARGDGQEALWEFAEAVRLDPDDWTARLKLGALALVAESFGQALEQADAAILLMPREPRSHLLRGQALEGLGRAAEAEGPYLRAVEIGAEDVRYLQVLGGYYLRYARRDQGESILMKLTEIDPGFDSYTALARFYAEEPRGEKAEQAFLLALESARREESVRAFENLARFYSSRGDPASAQRVLQEGITAMQGDPARSVQLMRVQASLLEARGDSAGSIDVLERAAELLSGDTEIHLQLASKLERKGDVIGAWEASKRAVEASPGDIPGRLKNAELMMRIALEEGSSERVAAATAIADAVLAEEPSNPDALFVRGKMAAAQGDNEAATRFLRASTDARPSFAQPYYLLGRILAATGDIRSARASLARALELDPSLTGARRSIIRAHMALGEHEYAVEQGIVYLRHNRDPETRLLVAQSLARLGRTREALTAIDAIPEQLRTHEVLLARARLLAAGGQIESARKVALAALASKPRQPAVLELLMAIDDQRGSIEDSGARIDAALASSPDDPTILHLRAVYAFRRNDLETAEAMLNRTLELDPGNVAAFEHLATILEQTDRIDEAIDTYQRALGERSDSALLHHLLAVLHQTQGMTDAAISGYENALVLDPDLAHSKNNLAYLLAESGSDLDHALDLAQEAKAQRPDDPGIADTLGWVLYRRGLSTVAVGYLREAVAGAMPGTPEIGVARYHLALAYEADDQGPRAVEALELALSELEVRQSRARAAGGASEEPEWSQAARDALARLKSAD